MKQSIKDILNGALRFDVTQSLTDDQKKQARANIGAGTSNLTLAGNGSAATAAKSDHIHNYAGSSSAGGAATSANKVNSNLVVKLNSGTTEDINLFTFNGSAVKTINITPSAIGAAASSHNHDDRYLTGINMNGESKGTSGVVDLGTVLTDASKFATSAQGTKADNAMPKSGGTFTGNISVPKTITFTDTTNPFIKMTTGGTDFYFQSAGGQFGLGPTWNKATHWDSNGNVTFPTTPKVGSSSLALKTDIPPKVTESTVSGWGFTKNEGTVTKVKINGTEKSPSSGIIDLGTVVTAHQDVSGKANLNGENTFTGKQLFNNTVGGVTNQLALNETQWDIFTCRDLTSPTTKTAIGKGYV